MKKSVKILLIVGIILTVLTAGGIGILYFIINLGQDFILSDYIHLEEPRITKMQDQKMLVVDIEGDPNEYSGDAFTILFDEFYKLKRENENVQTGPPIGRWPFDLNLPKEEWSGYYGLAMPKDMPEGDLENGARIETWEYGKVAEILHIGSYTSEDPTIDKLKKYVDEQGYTLVGDSHEEEYIKGPGMFFKGNEDNYYTIIRYRVKKKK